MRLSLTRKGVGWQLNRLEGHFGITWPWIWGYFERNGFKGDEMKFASAFYVTEPNVEILIFIDEPAKDVPEHSSMIVETKDTTELLNAVESFFILGAGS